jgi:HK97 family phage major capsid protein
MTQLLKDFLANKKIEYRSVQKALVEQRNDLVTEMEGIVAKAKEETRAFSDEESSRFETIKAEITKIDKTLKAEEESRAFGTVVTVKKAETEEEKRALEIAKEERAFVEFVREGRAANLPQGTNGAIIPKTISNRIVDKVKNLSPILTKANLYTIKGALSIPVYDYTQHTTAYQGAEFAAITASAGTFTSVDLNGFVIGSLALISKKLINNSEVDVLPFIINEIAKSIANFLENELVNGAGTNMKGLAQNANTFLGATTLVITPQELISMKAKVPQVFQEGAAWIMHVDTLAYLQGLTAGAGNNLLLFGNDLTRDGGLTLLGKPVYVSDNMPKYTTVGAKSIHFGDFSGLSVKFTKDVEMQVLVEKYADQYAVGCVAWAEVDSNITEPQKLITYVSK